MGRWDVRCGNNLDVIHVILFQNSAWLRIVDMGDRCRMHPESLRNTKQYNHLSYISLKIVPFCNYTLLQATVIILETFLEAILWKPFQLFRRIFNDVRSLSKAASLQCWFQSREQIELNWSHIPKATRDASVHFFIHSITEISLTENFCKLYHRTPRTFWRYYVRAQVNLDQKFSVRISFEIPKSHETIDFPEFVITTKVIS